MKGGILTDTKYMVDAIDQAIYGVMENPEYGGQVGCVIVGADGNIMSKAYNREVNGERLHAEEIALIDLRGMNISDATMYVTVEPCNGNVYHDRKHCCENIVESGVGRVVMANRKLKYEGGADYIRTNGVIMETLQNDTINQLCGILTKSIKDGSFSKKDINKLVSTRKGMKPIY